jgi:hypothetical protein
MNGRREMARFNVETHERHFQDNYCLEGLFKVLDGPVNEICECHTRADADKVAAALNAAEDSERAYALLNDINKWLVCSCIATPEDMAQSFEGFQQQIEALLNKAVGV